MDRIWQLNILLECQRKGYVENCFCPPPRHLLYEKQNVIVQLIYYKEAKTIAFNANPNKKISTVKHRNNGHLNNGMHRNNGQSAYSGAPK